MKPARTKRQGDKITSAPSRPLIKRTGLNDSLPMMRPYGALCSLSGALHLLTVLLAGAVVVIFWILACTPLIIPQTYSLKTTQQMINFVTPIVALLLSILFRSCLGRTNEALTAASLYESQLSLGALEMHIQASREDLGKLAKTALRRKPLRSKSLFFIVCLLAYTTCAWVLSVIFVVALHSSTIALDGSQPYLTARVRLPASIPVASDTCANSTGNPYCYYNLATAPLSTLLITGNFSNIAGVRLNPYQDPGGLPYDVLDHFVNVAYNSTYGDLTARYCAPRLAKKPYTCVPDLDNKRVNYEYHNIFNSSGTYLVTIDPGTKYAIELPRPAEADGSVAAWAIAASRGNATKMETIISATAKGATLLAGLAGVNYSVDASTPPFTMVCTLAARYTWSWIELSFANNLVRMDMLDNFETKLCSNDPSLTPEEYNAQNVPFNNIPLAIEGATDAVGSITGYSKLLNSDGSPFYDSITNTTSTYPALMAAANNMTELEYSLGIIYGTIMTMYADSQGGANVPRTDVLYVATTHDFEVRVQWTPLAVLAQVAALLVFGCTVWQAVRWAGAVTRAPRVAEKQDLLAPLDLVAYAAQHAEDIIAMARDDAHGRLRVHAGDKVGFGTDGIVHVRDLK